MDYIVKAQTRAAPTDDSPKGWYQLFLGSYEKTGDIFLTDGAAVLKIHKKGKRNAGFSKHLINLLNSGNISDAAIDGSLSDVIYSCDCEPCDNNAKCPYSTVM